MKVTIKAGLNPAGIFWPKRRGFLNWRASNHMLDRHIIAEDNAFTSKTDELERRHVEEASRRIRELYETEENSRVYYTKRMVIKYMT